jgi:hypothetical protein
VKTTVFCQKMKCPFTERLPSRALSLKERSALKSIVIATDSTTKHAFTTLRRSVFYMRESHLLSLTVRKACSTRKLMPNLELKQIATTFQTVEQGDSVNHASPTFCAVADPDQRVSALCCQNILGFRRFRSCAQRPNLALESGLRWLCLVLKN